MAKLTKGDLNFVLMRCPKDIMSLLKLHAGKLFLAGGFIRSTIAGEKVSDIDLFGESFEQLNNIATALTAERRARMFKTKNAITVLSPPRFPVQFITRWVFADPMACAASFDFTVCQAVIWAEAIQPAIPEGTITYRFHSACAENFYADLAARRLVYTFPERHEEVGGSFMRVVKFVKRGYTVQAPTLAGVVARLCGAVDFHTKRMDGGSDEKWLAQVLIGLLREVDPLTVIDGVDFVDKHEVHNEG